MKKAKHFKIYELVSREIYERRGERAWQLIDPLLIDTLDALREQFGPCTINNWKWNGVYHQSGLRDNGHYKSLSKYHESLSQHKYGRAADCKFKNHSAQEVRKYILEHPEQFPHITFLETGPLNSGKAMNWVHVDVRNGDGIVCWSPGEGAMKKEDVIRRKL
ncbi:hypothetical protein VPHD479_0337 [Vibrio phage D479]